MNGGPLDGLVPKAWRPPVGPPPSPMGLVPTAMAPVAPLMAPPTTPQNFLSPPAAMPWGGEGGRVVRAVRDSEMFISVPSFDGLK